MRNKKDNNKIAFVLGGMGSGGAERVVSLLANNYAKKGKTVDIITLLSSTCTYNLEPNVRLIPLVNPKKPRVLQLYDWIKGIRKYYKENRPYRVVSFFAKINILVLFALYRYRNDIVVSERNDPLNDGRGYIVRLLTEISYPKAKKVIFQTKWAQSCFSKKVIKNSEIIHNPVTEISIQRSKESNTIVNIGKLMDQKNHRLLILAFSQIAEEFPDYNLVIYGEGENRRQLEELVEKLNLNERVSLPGWTNEIHKKLANSTLFVLSSNYEGLSNALLEAMMIGVPCISTNCAGSNEIIRNNVNGIIVPIKDENKLASSMRKMLSDPEFALKLGEQGKKDVQKFRLSNVFYKWAKVID